MIIHDSREITKRGDGVVNAGTPQDAAARYMDRFESFHLGEKSRAVLEPFLRYLSRRDGIQKQLSYNFMIHCNDDSRAKAFVETFTEVFNLIAKTPGRALEVKESKLLDKPAEVLRDLPNCSVFVLSGCLTKEAYAPDSRNSAQEELKRKRDLAWAEWINACIRTPQTVKIITAPESVLRERFAGSDHLYYRIFRNHIYLDDALAEEVYEWTVELLKANKLTLTEEFLDALKTYVSVVYPKADLRNMAFAKDLEERILTRLYGDTDNGSELTPKHIPQYKKGRDYAEILKAMDDLVGLQKVKEVFLEIPYMLQETPKDVAPSLHMAFVGNPGTGKTTVAQLAAELLYSIGVIRKNKVVSVSALDLIGRYVGETPRITKEYCQRAYGGILFIDEAYLIAQTSNGSANDAIRQECLGTLLQEMENHRDNLIVLFAGYEKEMKSLLYESNSGLGSRLYKVVEFEDYTDDELMEIFQRMCKKEGFTITREAEEKVKLKLSSARYSRDFGNARTVRNVFVEAKKEYRRLGGTDRQLNETHITLETALRDFTTVRKELDEMIGLESAKTEISRAIETCRFSKEIKEEIPISKHMLFLGNAGTGKSTVAKLFGQMLFSIGASKSPNCVSIAAGDLLGRRNPIESLQEQCRLASGGVLFIDEAYAIQSSSYCASIISVLLDVMEEQRDTTTLILAGYEKEMKDFLDRNQGLKSRFPVTVWFEDYSPDQLAEIFTSFCAKYHFTVSDAGMDKFRKVIASEKAGKDFGNARTVRNIFEQSFRLHAVHFMQDPVEEKRMVIDETDIDYLSPQREIKHIGY